MRRNRFASHTPEEVRRLSNLGHLLKGLVLTTVASTASRRASLRRTVTEAIDEESAREPHT